MKLLEKLLVPREVNAALQELDNARRKVNNSSFELLYEPIKSALLADTAVLTETIRQGTSPRELVYTVIANVAGEHAGDSYREYHGALLPPSPRENYLDLFDTALDQLSDIGAMPTRTAFEQKKSIRETITAISNTEGERINNE